MTLMLSLVVDFIVGFFGFLDGILPASPFREIINSWEGLGNGLGWLNWLVPVGLMLTILTAWLALMVIWFGIDVVVRRAKGITSGKAVS